MINPNGRSSNKPSEPKREEKYLDMPLVPGPERHTDSDGASGISNREEGAEADSGERGASQATELHSTGDSVMDPLDPRSILPSMRSLSPTLILTLALGPWQEKLLET